MKERIYSIPLTDALRENCGCILCSIEKKLEDDALNYFLGPAMMEPDTREITNKKGFCRRHLPMLFDKGNRLGLALVLETHVKELSGKMTAEKQSGFMKKGLDASLTAKKILDTASSCAICDKMNSQMADAAGNLAYLWAQESDFRDLFMLQGTLCPEHAGLVLSVCDNETGNKLRDAFTESILFSQKKLLDNLYKDLHEFVLSFDYRNSDKPLSEKASKSVESAVKYLSKN